MSAAVATGLEFAQAIRELRRRLRLTQAALAIELGVDQTAVSQYERAVVKPSALVLISLCALSRDEGASIDLGQFFLDQLRLQTKGAIDSILRRNF